MNPPLVENWKKLKIFEKRGDLKGQADLLLSVLPPVHHRNIQDTLHILKDNHARKEEREPSLVFQLEQEQAKLQLCNSKTCEVRKDIPLPRPPRFVPNSQLNWTPTGQVELLVLQVEQQKIHVFAEFARLTGVQRGVGMNPFQSFYNIPDYHPQWLRLGCRQQFYGAIPLEAVSVMPYDLFVSPQHPILGVGDRGAGQLHVIQREQPRLVKSWKVASLPSKKAICAAFHPDSKRIFVTCHENGLLQVIDRTIVMKKIPLALTGIFGSLACSPRGDLLYLLVINPETRRPDLVMIDTEKFKVQQTIALEGEAFSSGADPRDVLELTPDGQYAVIMVSKNQPALFTPNLLLVDLAQGQICDRQILNPQQKPVNVTFPIRQLVSPEIKLLQTLLQSALIKTEDILHAFQISAID